MTSTSPFIAKPFSYFDIKGECNFPSPDFIRSNAQQGIVTALVLDANICLNLSNYARGQKDPVKESMFRQFLLAIELVSVDVVPYFGCLELASTRGSDQLEYGQADQHHIKCCTRPNAEQGVFGMGAPSIYR